MLPLNLTTDGGPIYVNERQYHGIIRRRHCRAKAELKNKVFKERKVCILICFLTEKGVSIFHFGGEGIYVYTINQSVP